METAVYGRDEKGKYRDKHGIECQNSYRTIVWRAEERGMKVNHAKTSMLCSSGAQSYDARSHIFDGGGAVISSGGQMKVLGFLLAG